ncbi:MAG: tetratricopeptide repeat protein [Magnetococcales bacterium]|nr:tetratricopeptide repeat protein [Magnetococcales bacterium]
MSWIWILPLILLIALIGVFHPLFTRRGHAPLPVGVEGDPREALLSRRDAVLVQLKELDLEGSDDPQQGSTRAELERELVAILTRLDGLTATPAVKAGDGVIKKSPLDMAMGAAGMLSVAFLASLLYLWLGTPQPIAPATEHPAASADILRMVEQAAQRLRSNPDDIAGWQRLARSYVALNRSTEAMDAYRHILSRQPEDEDALLALSELQLQSPDPAMQAEAENRLEALLVRHPDHPDALWFLGLQAARTGQKSKALTLLNRLKPLLPAGSPAILTVDQAIAQIGKP